jgi:hypothetical protein
MKTDTGDLDTAQELQQKSVVTMTRVVRCSAVVVDVPPAKRRAVLGDQLGTR